MILQKLRKSYSAEVLLQHFNFPSISICFTSGTQPPFLLLTILQLRHLPYFQLEPATQKPNDTPACIYCMQAQSHFSVKPTAQSYCHCTESKTFYSTNHSMQNHCSTNQNTWILHNHGTVLSLHGMNHNSFPLIRKRLYYKHV